MNRVLIMTLIAMFVSACTTPTRDVLIEPVKRLSTKVNDKLEIQIPVGEVRIVGVDEGELKGIVEFYCESNEGKCARKAAKAKFVTTVIDDRTIISFEPDRALSYRKTDIKIRFHVPVVETLSVVMGPGDITIENIRGCLSVDMDAGNIDVKMALASIAKVHLDANIGDASLKLPDTNYEGKRRLLIGAEVNWDKGPGTCDLDVQLQAGDVSLELTS